MEGASEPWRLLVWNTTSRVVLACGTRRMLEVKKLTLLGGGLMLATGCRGGLRDRVMCFFTTTTISISQTPTAAAAQAEFNFDNGRADDAIGKRKHNGTQRIARLSHPPYFALQPALYALLPRPRPRSPHLHRLQRKQVLALALTLALALALVLAHAPYARPLRPPLPPPPLRFEFRESDRRIQ